ncbi:2-dehydro-3-deoxygalactonokinase [Burkholderia dolosa]|nr:2-dehydro-3-deoxygalactonokinase [Burkholderia dolosa]
MSSSSPDTPTSAAGSVLPLSFASALSVNRHAIAMSQPTNASAPTPVSAPPSSFHAHAARASGDDRGTHADCPVLIGLDWGTTSLRAYLFDAAGRVVAQRSSAAGIMNLPCPADEGGFDTAFDAVCGEWLAQRADLPVVASGMVGSAQGWMLAPYAEVPAGADSLVRRLVQVRTQRGTTISIVPGLIEDGELPNVMRGEETQIVGASLQNAALASGGSRMLVGLPGTHAKWAIVVDGTIQRFYTFMTGEVFAALRGHTILGRTMVAPSSPQTDAFLRGVDVARRTDSAGVLSTIFTMRTLGLTARLPADQQSDYLSGLLIGHELAGLERMLAAQQMTLRERPPILVGDASLCARYRLALSLFGCADVTLTERATELGLWSIAVKAGLVAATSARHVGSR